MSMSMMKLISVLFTMTLCLSTVYSDTDCSNIVAPDGTVYDLGPLINKQMNQMDGNKYYYWWTICGISSNRCGSCPQPGFCQSWGTDPVNKPEGNACVGLFSDIVGMDEGAGVEIKYSGGDQGRLGNIFISCDPSVEEGQFVIESPPAVQVPYVIRFNSKYACSESGAFSAILFIFILLTIILYVGVGILINKFVRRMEGIEIFPHVHFWKETLPSNVKEGASFIVSKVTGKK
eukprot:TRINITY_DN10440_c0_g1_i1.p1 TRINITY_DN10440_c0_g1~~TRINITY_DN10440_c0_g1_i1.p1  ORF type:complete len:233 (-),score=51.12 TRINITY_DN10440_c0_g1_i1:31-729(-)